MNKAATARRRTSGSPHAGRADTPFQPTGGRTTESGDWRGAMLGRIRALILAADPGMEEEVKWRKPSNPAGVPTWTHAGIVCTGETYRDKVKLTFAQGALLEDPSGLFNASLDGRTRRAIDFHAGGEIDEKALQALIRAAVTLNASRATIRRSRKKSGGSTS